MANYSSNSVSILLGDGSGGFAPAPGSPVPVGSNPQGVVVGDFNGDGIADLAVANFSSNNVSILLGDGSGGFVPAPGSPVAVGSSPYSVAVGYFNADGIADLAVANNLANTVSILLGDGGGAFAPAPGSPIAVGGNPRGVSVGDFNGDGIADLAVANSNSDNVNILLGDGSGGFAPASGSPVTAGDGPQGVVVGDFNGDGIADLALPNFSSANVSILLGDGSGGFAPAPGSPVAVGSGPRSVAVADFNGDGIADLVVPNSSASNANILLNHVTQTATAELTGVNIVGSGTHDVNASYPGDTNFSASTSTTIPLTATQVTTTLALTAVPTTSTFGQQVVLTATLSPSSTGSITTNGQTVSFLNGATSLGTGTLASGVATLSVTTLPVGTSSLTAVYAGDTNFVASTSPSTSFVVIQPLAATTTILAVSPSTSPVPAKTAVMLTATVSAGATPVHPGRVTFCDATTVALCKGLAVVGTAQLTSAGTAVLKFVPGSGSHNFLAVFAGTKTNATSSSTAQALTVSYFSTTSLASSGSAGDYTLTATVVGTGSFTPPAPTGTVSFLDTTNSNSVLGTAPLGTATLTPLNFTNASGSPIKVGTSATAVAIGDFNGDGIADVAVTNGSNNNVSILLGDGSGGFAPAPESPVATGAGPTAVATGDFNGDGIADLAVTNSGTANVSILLGDGSGGFAPAPGSPLAGGPFPVAVATGDFNGDGIADLAVANSGNVIILLGDGSGGFTPSAGSPVAQGSSPSGVAIGDFNGDGIADLAVSSASSSTGVSILLGDGSGGFAPAPGSPVAAGSAPAGVATGDFNGDGIADLAVANSSSNNVSILFGDGSGGFAPAPGSPVAAGSRPQGVAIGDFNGDGIADLAVPNETSNNVSILLGDGSGGFAPAPGSPVAVGNSPNGVAVGDFNGDGIADLVVPNRTANNVSILLNQVTQTATAELTGVNIVGSGTRDVNASYPGDTNFGGSISLTIPLTAAQVTTTLALTAVPTTSTFGQAVVLTATISSTPLFPVGSLTPTGTVTFFSNGAEIGTGTVTSGVATLNITSLPAGTDSLAASYAGDTNFVASTSPAVPFVVSKATPVITWANPAAISYGTALSATQLNATANVPGTFAYSPAMGVVLNAGTQTLNVTFTPTDTTNYMTATASVTLVVNMATLTVTANSASRPYGTANPAFTSTITGFVNGDTQTSAVTGAPSLTTTATTASPAGTYPITAALGTLVAANYTFTFVNATLTVNKASLTVTANDASRAYGVVDPAFTSTITGFVNGDTQASAVTGAPSLTTTAATASPAGTYPIAAALGTLAAANYTFTFVNGTLTVTKGTPGSGGVAAVTVVSSLNPSTYGTSVTFTATVPAGATGTATFEDNGTAISGAVPISGTTATFATSTLVAGSHAITAVYSGDSNYNGANSLVLTQTVDMATTGPSTTLSVNPGTVMYGDPAVLTAVVGPPSGATGTVSFHEGATLLGTSSLDGSTTAVFSVSTLNVGTHTITATYNGDVNFPASTSNPVTLTVTQLTGPGGGTALTVTVNDATRTTTEANPPFSHTVAGELVNGDTYATAVTGTPTYSTAAGTTAGTFAITVTGLSSANYTLAFVPGTLTVVPSSSTTTLAASPNASQYGDPVTLTATVTSGATGTASFYDSSVFLGEGTVTGGVATLITTTLNAGTHTITAIYNGDATYASSTSGPTTVTVAKKTAEGGGPALTVTVENASREFETANPEFAHIVSGTLVNGDTYATAVTGVPVYTSTDTPTSPVGSTFPINVSGLVSQNYTLTTVPGTLTIVTAPTTTALATSVTSAQYGDPVTLTATVAPSSATGTVVFSNGSTALGTATVSGGTATLSTSALGVGTYTMTASYEGDGNFAESTSSAVTVTVTPRTGPGGVAALTVTVTDASRQYGQGNPAFSYTVSGTLVNGDTYATAVTGVPVYSTPATVTSPVGTYPISITGGLSSANYSLAFVNGTLTVNKGTPTVTVASSLNPSTYGTSVTLTAMLSAGATGTVTFMDGTTSIGTGTINSGIATLTTSSLAVGTHSITAQYGGDTNYNGSTTAALIQTVNMTTSTVALASSLNPSTFDASVIFTATLPTDATGTVTFHDGTTSMGTGTISSGVATLTTSSLAVGTHSITAQYGGDTNYDGSTSAALTQTVNMTASTVALTSSLNPSTFGASVIFTATITSGATGTVTFHEGPTVLGTGTISSGGVATLTTSTLAGGPHSITAQYGGDSNYNGSTSAVLTQTVNMTTSTVTLASSLNPSTFGATVALTATVTSGATGTVTFHEGATVLGTGTISNGVATLTTSTLAGGTHSITAQYGGDTNYSGVVSTPVSQVVNKATLTVTANDASRSYGTANPAFTSTITGFVNGDTQESVVTGSPSLMTTATTVSPAGTYPITAAPGNLATNNNYIFTFVNGTLTVTPAAGETTTLIVSPTTVMYGEPAVLTAVVGPTAGATGTVSFHEGTSLLGTASLDNSATAVFSVSTLSAGTHTITATYTGDVSFPASASNPVTLTVTQRTGAGGGASLTVTVNDATRTTSEANPPFSHTVAGDLVNGDTPATAVTGTPTYSTTAGTTAGTFAITVSGLTSQNYVLAFVPGTLTVVPSLSSTTLATSPSSPQYGDPVTLTATVTSGATGTASFYDGSVLLGQSAVTGGVATLSTTTLNAGTHTITATYNGDATYASSMSGPATVTVAKNTAPGSLLTVTVLNESREYGTANPEFAYVVSGTLVNGDTYATAVTGVPVYSVADSPNSPVGSTFPINVSGLVSQNYTLTFVPGTLTIVNAATTTALTTSVTATQYGDPVTLTATVAPINATGTVVFSNGSTVLGTATVSGGVATLSTSTLSVGTNTITASYEGDGNYAASTSSAATVTVAKRTGPGGGAALTITVTNTSRQYGQGNPAFSYTVSGTLVNGDTYAAAVTGVPVYSTTATVTSPVGTYPVSITGGLSSANYSIAFVNGILTVSKGTPSVTAASSQNPSTPAASVTFTATLSAGATGTVTFMDGTTAMGAVTVSNGTASFATTTLSVGTHSITAVYGGDANYNGVTSPALAQVVNKTATIVTVASSRNPAPAGTSITFTATVPAGATGTVQFLDGTTVLGTGTVSGGTASFSTTTLSVGTHSITAVYSSDATYSGATSSAVSQVITQAVSTLPPTFAVASTTGPQLIPPGASASYSITVTPVNGAFNNVVTLTATNLPLGSSYTFAPTTLTPGSAGATSTFTVSVPKQSAALRRISKTPFAVAVLLLPIALLRRTRARPPRLLLWLLLGLTSFGTISGCGAGGYFNQPQQTYTITITATSGNVANSSTVTLTVQ